MKNHTRSGIHRSSCGLIVASILAFGFGTRFVAAQNPQPAELAFKNIKVLTGVPEDKIQPTMWFFTAALGVRCRYCHEDDNTLRALDTKPQKATARKMIEMTIAINKGTFGGRPIVTCYSCHQGNPKPVGVPLLGTESKVATEPAKSPNTDPAPPLEQILSKYENAIGGSTASEKLSTLVITGTVADIKGKTLPVDVLAKGPETLMIITHEHEGDTILAMNGQTGWRTTEEQRNPRDLRGSDVELSKLEVPVYVAGRVRHLFSDLKVAPRPEPIDHRDAYVVSGRSAGSTAVKLYFDKESGMLSRLIYNIETAFGPYYTQIDYFDFRDAAGLKVPYRWKISRVRADVSDYQVTDLKANVPLAETRFAKPNVPRAK